MKRANILINIAFLMFGVLSAGMPLGAQTKEAEPIGTGKPVMWESVDIAGRDLFAGPGGDEMRPDLSKIEFIKEEEEGYNKKFRIKDGSGKIWVAKLTRETQSETAAVRLLWGIGYKTEINYLVPTITIPGKGTFKNVRLEARPEGVKRLDEWKWKENPFVGTKELQGLKIMMVLMTNWDTLDLQNKVLAVGDERHYVISDLGATFGKLGNNSFPIVHRVGRQIGSAEHFITTRLVDKVENGEVKLAYKGKNADLFKRISVDDARWLADLLGKLSDEQISDAFRAANYSPAEIASFTTAVKNKIGELKSAGSGENVAGK